MALEVQFDPHDMDEAVWATWPWNRCSAVIVTQNMQRRCDLRRGHLHTEHCSDQGMDRLFWVERTL